MAGKEKIARNAETPAQRFERVISKVAARHQRARGEAEEATSRDGRYGFATVSPTSRLNSPKSARKFG